MKTINLRTLPTIEAEKILNIISKRLYVDLSTNKIYHKKLHYGQDNLPKSYIDRMNSKLVDIDGCELKELKVVSQKKDTDLNPWYFRVDNIAYIIKPYTIMIFLITNKYINTAVSPIDGCYDNLDINNWDLTENVRYNKIIKNMSEWKILCDSMNQEFDVTKTLEYRCGIDKTFLQTMFDYNSDKGKLYWKERDPIDGNSKCFNEVYAGKEVGSAHIRHDRNSTPYINTTLTFDGKQYGFRVHRLIWIMEYDEIPNIIDHKDGNGLNNKPDNLRNVTIQKNNMNKFNEHMGLNINKATGKYRAHVAYFGKKFKLPYRTTKEEALRDRIEADKIFGYDKLNRFCINNI